MADQLRRLRQCHGGLQHMEGNGFGQRVGNAHAQRRGAAQVAPAVQRVLQRGTQRKDFIGIAHHQPACVGGLNPAPGLAQQRLADALLQLLDLAAERLRRQVQLLAGAHDAAGVQHRPEVVQVFVIHGDRLCRHFGLFEATAAIF